MSWDIDLFSLLVLLGASQGLILSFILFFSKKEDSPGKNYLGFFILILTYNGFETFNWSSGLNDSTLLFGLLPFVLIFGLGPALYLYVYKLTHTKEKLPKSVFWHFIPIFIQLFIRIGLLTSLVLWMNNIEFFSLSPAELENWYAKLSEPVSVVAFWIYLLISCNLFLNFKKENQANGSPVSILEKRAITKSLAYFLSAIIILAILWALTIFFPRWIIAGDNQYYFIEIFLVVLVYWVAFSGYRRVRFIYVESPRSIPVIQSRLSNHEMRRIAQLIQNTMEFDRLFLDAELTVGKLAVHLNMNPKDISCVLNQQLQKGFNDFVNEYRVLEVKAQLLNPQKKHLTIAGIALDAGFNSQATFGRAFKSITGMSPKVFLSLRTRKYA